MARTRSWSCLSSQVFGYDDFEIRPISDGDIQPIREWRNQQKAVLRQKETISIQEQTQYFKKNIWPSMEEKNPLNILMSFYSGESLVGYGGLVHIDWGCRRGELSFLVNPKFTRCEEGYRTLHHCFLKLICRMAFEDLKMHKVFTETWSFREKHIQNLERFGFSLDGVLRDHVLENEMFHDAFVHSIMSSEYWLMRSEDGRQ